MPIFKYEAMDSQGVGIKDEIEALSEKEALSKIRNMGYFPTKVNSQGGIKKPVRRANKSRSRRGAKGKVKIKVITQFARQLSTLQDAGLPILRSLRILEEQQKRGDESHLPAEKSFAQHVSSHECQAGHHWAKHDIHTDHVKW